MNLNLPENVRGTIYVTGIFGQPIAVYLMAKGYIGTLEMALWSGLVAVAFALARLNLGNSPQDKP